MRRALLVAAVLLGAGGCYQSHERDDAGSALADAARDAGAPWFPIPPTGCGDAYLTIDTELAFGPNPSEGGGTLFVSDRAGERVAEVRTEEGRARLCVSRSHAPLELLFLQEGVSQAVLGVDADFLDRSLSRPLYAFGPDLVRGTLDRQTPGSRFLLQTGVIAQEIERVSASPFEIRCGRPAANDCRLRFLELAEDGALLGAGSVSWRFGVEDIELSARGSVVRRDGRFQVRLPIAGPLRGIALDEVRPLDCATRTPRDSVGGAMPGTVDLWRCSLAGQGTIDVLGDDTVDGRFAYVAGPDAEADVLMARLGAPGSDLEATSLVPCCADAPTVLTFPSVERLDGRLGPTSIAGMSVSVRASGFEHAFVFFPRTNQSSFRVWSFQRGGQLDFRPDSLSDTLRDHLLARRVTDVWIGAVTTRDGAPWDGGLRVQMVQRRIGR